MYFLSETVTLIPLVFPFLLTETSHQESILLILFHFSDNELSLQMDFIKLLDLYRLKIVSINKYIN